MLSNFVSVVYLLDLLFRATFPIDPCTAWKYSSHSDYAFKFMWLINHFLCVLEGFVFKRIFSSQKSRDVLLDELSFPVNHSPTGVCNCVGISQLEV